MAYKSLNELPAQEAVRWLDGRPMEDGRRFVKFGAGTEATSNFDDFLEEVNERLAHWRAGHFLRSEVAYILANTHVHINRQRFASQMKDAVYSGALLLRENGLPLSAADILRDGISYSSQFRQDDINLWLRELNAGFVLEYPYLDEIATQASTEPAQVLASPDDGLLARYATQEYEKKAAGRCNLEEAAAAISASGEASEEQMLAKFVAAAADGTLATYMPGRSAKNDYAKKVGRFKQPNTFYDECYWDELNAWLRDYEPRMAFRFANPNADAIEAPDQAAFNSALAMVCESVSSGPWFLKKPQRYQGYGKPLYDVLKGAYRQGKVCPTARDVLDAFKAATPPEVIEVMADGIKYYDSKGDPKLADLRAIAKAIARLVELSPDSPE